MNHLEILRKQTQSADTILLISHKSLYFSESDAMATPYSEPISLLVNGQINDSIVNETVQIGGVAKVELSNILSRTFPKDSVSGSAVCSFDPHHAIFLL